jgi:hypothetical protein
LDDACCENHTVIISSEILDRNDALSILKRGCCSSDVRKPNVPVSVLIKNLRRVALIPVQYLVVDEGICMMFAVNRS